MFGSESRLNGLILGGDSEIGKACISDLNSFFPCYLNATSRMPKNRSKDWIFFDLSKSSATTIDFEFFDFIVLCASMTSIQDCEAQKALCFNLNVVKTKEIIQSAISKNCFVVFLSSDAVFDGTEAFCEPDSKRRPMSNYGLTKALVEEHIVENCGHMACVLRLTKVISANTSFISNWQNQLNEGKGVKVFANKLLSPVSINEVTKAIARCVVSRKPGIYQIGGNHEISYLDFAKEQVANLGYPDASFIILDDDSDKNCEPQHSSLKTVIP